MSFVDKLREDGPETWSTAKRYGGFDPDLHNSGLAFIEVSKSTRGRKKLRCASLSTVSIAKRFKDIRAVSMMGVALADWFDGRNYSCARLLVESQRIYPNPNATRQKLIGQGNDLLMLATVSGIAAGLASAAGLAVDIERPQDWKKQKKKEPMHRRAMKLLNAEEVPFYYNDKKQGADLDSLPRESVHALDALCMALIGAGYVV